MSASPTVVEYMHPGRLATLTRRMAPSDARPLLEYLETLTPQQERDLAGARDRLAIPAESDVGPALDPATGGVQIDLRDSLDRGDVVLFRLEADRRPLAAAMVARRSSRTSSRSTTSGSTASSGPGSSSSTSTPQWGSTGRAPLRPRPWRPAQPGARHPGAWRARIDRRKRRRRGRKILNQTAGNLEVLAGGTPEHAGLR